MRKVREIYERYERKLSAFSIVTGFIFDSLTLVRIDLVVNHLLMAGYFAIAAVGIFLINLREEGRARFLSDEQYAWLFIAMQFSFGGLFGRFFLYYFHSGIIGTSWVFLATLMAFLIGNEFAKKHYTRLVLQVDFFFLALFLFLIYFVPILAGSIGGGIFIISGIAALAILFIFLRLLLRLTPVRIRSRSREIVASIAAIYLAMNVMYFANIIPPIPLALRSGGIYHRVTRSGDRYLGTTDERRFLDRFRSYERIRITPNQELYAYSAVFAPTDLGTSIAHVWQRYDETQGEWIDQARVLFPIVGGQDRGYRGYTIKSNVTPGLWRVNIETLRGAVIGRLTFHAIREDGVISLSTKEL